MSRATRSGLAPWVCAPLVGLVAVWLAIRATPSLECGEGIDRSSEETVLLVITGTASLGAAWTGALRLGAVRGKGRWRSLRDPALVVLTWVLAAAATVVVESEVFWGVVLVPWAVALVLTPIALLGLLVAWARGRKVEETKMLLPVYLLGAAVCYLAISLTWLFLNSGLGC